MIIRGKWVGHVGKVKHIHGKYLEVLLLDKRGTNQWIETTQLIGCTENDIQIGVK